MCSLRVWLDYKLTLRTHVAAEWTKARASGGIIAKAGGMEGVLINRHIT